MFNKYISSILVFLQFSLMLLIVLFRDDFIFSSLSISILIIGLLIGLSAISYNKIGNFNIKPEMKENAKLITTGPYAYIRHPMYLCVIITMLGFVSNISNIILLFLLIFVLYIKAKKEESAWIKENKQYISYKKRTKLILP